MAGDSSDQSESRIKSCEPITGLYRTPALSGVWTHKRIRIWIVTEARRFRHTLNWNLKLKINKLKMQMDSPQNKWDPDVRTGRVIISLYHFMIIKSIIMIIIISPSDESSGETCQSFYLKTRKQLFNTSMNIPARKMGIIFFWSVLSWFWAWWHLALIVMKPEIPAFLICILIVTSFGDNDKEDIRVLEVMRDGIEIIRL